MLIVYNMLSIRCAIHNTNVRVALWRWQHCIHTTWNPRANPETSMCMTYTVYFHSPFVPSMTTNISYMYIIHVLSVACIPLVYSKNRNLLLNDGVVYSMNSVEQLLIGPAPGWHLMCLLISGYPTHTWHILWYCDLWKSLIKIVRLVTRLARGPGGEMDHMLAVYGKQNVCIKSLLTDI